MIRNFLKKSDWVPWAVLALLGVLQLQALPGDYLGKELDDAYYVLAARGLLHGEFRLGISPGNPPITFITPGFPLLLVPAAVCGEAHGCFHLTAWFFLVACDIFVWLWLRRRLSRPQALLCTVLFGLSPLTLARAGKVMTEIPALALTLLLFLLMDIPAWPAWGSGLLLAYIWLIRQGTVALFPAIWGWYAVKKRWKNLGESIVPVLAVMLANTLWFSKIGAATPKLDELFASYSGGLLQIPHVVVTNWSYYIHLWGRLWLPTYPVSGILEVSVGAVLISFCILGLRRIVEHKGWDPAVMWLFFGFLLHTFWPWTYERYLMSFLPVLIWTLWEGVGTLIPTFSQRGRRGLLRIPLPQVGEGRGEGKVDNLTVVFLVVLFVQFYGQGSQVIASAQARAVPELQETYAWIRENIPPGQALASLLYSRDALYAGHPVAPLPAADPDENLAGILRRGQVSYILLQDTPDLGSSLGSDFGPVKKAAKLREIFEHPPFSTVYRNKDEKSVIYRVPGSPAEHS